MTKLTYQQRKWLAEHHPEDFVYPPSPQHPLGMYPIEDAAHARDAEARVGAYGTPAQRRRVSAAVHKKFPRIVHTVEW